ncbi:Hypothetical protein R9X50_00452500 [Acrodontium crateriforme]|uniref:Fork-head domain-containing protein n=1 Tax=Acrodontium crateriforme TaxID=150365 RepID=A0AAQ3M5I6_9PEZI|nr:Hypothetical protein R9X50_00452500 [Acrodontium crateriforme]
MSTGGTKLEQRSAPDEHMSMASTPRDCVVAQPAHTLHDLPHQRKTLSFSLPSDWQANIEDLEQKTETVFPNLDLFGQSVVSPAMFPRQSIEFNSDMAHLQQSQSMDNISSNQLDQDCMESWPQPSNMLTSAYPPIPQVECAWGLPQSFNEPMALTGLPMDVNGFIDLGNSYNTSSPMQFVPDRHTRHNSPFTQESVGCIWRFPDTGRMTVDSTSDELTEGESSDPCYAQLLYKCLKEAQDNTLSLRELYEWVSLHSQKAKDPKSRGWQNSVRHNLSMNAAFERVHAGGGAVGTKKGSLWRLTETALRDGVISTTRYRKDPKRKTDRRGTPAVKRQISGAKGGQATRNATRRQQQALHQARSYPSMSNQHYEQRPILRQYDSPYFSPTPFQFQHNSPQPVFMTQQQPASPYFVHFEERSSMPPSSDPGQSPQLFQSSFETQMKPIPVFTEFQNGYIDFMNCGFPGSQDVMAPDTPSLATEASFMTDDGSRSLTSPTSVSREAPRFH